MIFQNSTVFKVLGVIVELVTVEVIDFVTRWTWPNKSFRYQVMDEGLSTVLSSVTQHDEIIATSVSSVDLRLADSIDRSSRTWRDISNPAMIRNFIQQIKAVNGLPLFDVVGAHERIIPLHR